MDSGDSVFSPKLFLKRLKRKEFLTVYIAILILSILLIVMVAIGENSPRIQELDTNQFNPWVVKGLWILATILLYVGFYFIWQNVDHHYIPLDLIVSSFFLISSFLFIFWAAIYYYAYDVVMSFWIALAIFIYTFWIFVFVWLINPIAALFFLPNLLMYIYLLYSTIQIALVNNINI